MLTSMKDSKSHIYELQYYLRTIQIVTGQENLINPDGIYGSETEEAVKQFQRNNGLPITSVVDNRTWERIYEEYLHAEEALAVAEGVRVYPLGVGEIKIGDRGDEIYVLQFLLKKNDERFGKNSNINLNGVFDEATRQAVIELQRLLGLEQNGIVDKHFWNRFVRFHNVRYLNE